MNIEAIDSVVMDAQRWAPRFGWHDDHRAHDRTPAYLPAIMQVRDEFAGLIEVLRAQNCLGTTKALQLGMGECDASHAAWRKLCQRVVLTLDFRVIGHNETMLPGVDIRSPEALKCATDNGPYDVLFIDAGHKLVDIEMDHRFYGRLVRPGGIISFHDALKRPGYEDEIDVWKYLANADVPVHMIGSEVGIAWIVKE